MYHNSIRNIQTVLRNPYDLYVFHFRQFDKVLHTSQSQLDDCRENVLAMHAGRVALQLSEAIAAMSTERPVSLLISSDHGSTHLPPGFSRSIPVPIGANLVEEHSSRAVEIGKNFDRSATAAYDRETCTYLDPETFGLAAPVLLTRGFSSWSAVRRGSGYVHGGALPEELLVPLLHFRKQARPYTPLRLVLSGGELRRNECLDVVLKIINSNDYSIARVDLYPVFQNGRLPHQGFDRLEAHCSIEVSVPVRIEPHHTIRNQQVDLCCSLSAIVFGRAETREFRDRCHSYRACAEVSVKRRPRLILRLIQSSFTWMNWVLTLYRKTHLKREYVWI